MQSDYIEQLHQNNSSLLNLSHINIPIHINNNHWILVVVDIKRNEVVVFDSLQGSNEDYRTILEVFITYEHCTY